MISSHIKNISDVLEIEEYLHDNRLKISDLLQ